MSEVFDHPGQAPSAPWLGLLDALIDDVLGLISIVWLDLAETAWTLTEPDITLAIWRRLLPNLADRPYTVAIDDPGEVTLDLIRGMGKAANKIDLVMRPHQYPLGSYPIEAKVLVGTELRNYKPREQAQAYVVDGIARFVTGGYRTQSGRAAMLGYVLRGPESKCVQLVNEQLAADTILTNKVLSKQGDDRYLSGHLRYGYEVRIDHLWLRGSGQL